MATLAELYEILTDTVLQNKIRAAMCKTAVAIKFEDPATPNHAERLAVAKRWLNDVNGNADDVQRYVIASYSSSNPSDSSATVLAMDDATIQSHVDAWVSVFIAE